MDNESKFIRQFEFSENLEDVYGQYCWRTRPCSPTTFGLSDPLQILRKPAAISFAVLCIITGVLSFFQRLVSRASLSAKLHRYVKQIRKLYDTRYKCNHKHDPKVFYVIKVTVPKKTYLLSFSSLFDHTYVIMKLNV